MVFRFLGHLIHRGWPLWLIAWAALLLVGRLAAPPWSEVAQDKQFAFLPADSPSRRADEIYATAFPEERVYERRSTNQRLLPTF